ncbi:multidrug resistance protein MdtA precursor [mine drainage metagenome]|uniref:Multidrug resistance protein MdtA n=1 Tax=mine drainage metagenome TaxID=410659 RepID=A0A1J5T0V6_9ZZZZ
MSPDPKALERLRINRPHAQRRPFPWGLAIGISAVLLLLAGVAGWWLTRPRPVDVRTAVAQAVDANAPEVLLNASGYVTARLEATVSSKVTGKVEEVLVEEGQRVDAGQVLARLDASNTEAGLQLARAQLDAARKGTAETAANLHLAEIELARTRTLDGQGAVPVSDLDQAQANVSALRARLAVQQANIGVAEREVAVWQQQLDDTVIRAPFAGIVTSKNAQPGEMISPMSSGGFTRTGICTLVDMNSLEIEVDVNESYINRVEPGRPVVAVLDAYPDWRIPAKVIAIIPTADRQKASVKVRVGFLKLDPRILPDMGVKVAFEGAVPAAGAASRRSVRIPSSALVEREGRPVVFVAADGHAERRAVAVGMKTDDTVSITAGLTGGEAVVLDPPAALSDGSPVSITKP